ncbi:MAG: succinate dehydrogenase, cytochrome b556 subunit [Gammaproteobacteria bacterium]|nr:succinate dehydrogenase, cytochrome b556 subunit [Gammaproteobacteria bacterium]
MQKQVNRPVFINLFKIKFPLTAIASILHRVAGVLMIFSLPLLIYMFNLSLQDKASFDQAISIASHPLASILLYILLWSISHHFFAGIRYFLIDFDCISGKQSSRNSAIIIIVAGLLPVLALVWYQL